jgi:hypothetical protein
MRKERIVAYISVLSQNVAAGTEGKPRHDFRVANSAETKHKCSPIAHLYSTQRDMCDEVMVGPFMVYIGKF